MYLTVVVPTWKRPRKLEACLKSLEAQTSLPDQVIVVVRPEDAEAINIVSALSKVGRLPLTLLYAELPGVINAENTAIKNILSESFTEVVSFMDDDAVAFPEWIAKIKDFFQTRPTAAALGGPDIIMSEPWTFHDVKVNNVGMISLMGKVTGNHHHQSSGLRKVHVLKGVNMSIRRSFLRELDSSLQGMDPARGNGVFWELDLCLSIAQKSDEIYFDPQLLINHDSDHTHFIPSAVIASTAYNLTRVMRKHLTLGRYLIFLLYSFFVGNGHIRGVIKTLHSCLRSRNLSPLKDSYYSLRGFFSALVAP